MVSCSALNIGESQTLDFLWRNDTKIGLKIEVWMDSLNFYFLTFKKKTNQMLTFFNIISPFYGV